MISLTLHKPLLLVLAAAGLFSVCTPASAHGQAATGSVTSSAFAGSREIRASGQGSVSVQANGEMATIRIANHLLVIKGERLLLDGKERARLPVRATEIIIESFKGRITVTADGKEVLNVRLRSA